MSVKFIFDVPILTAWVVSHQTYNMVSKCEEAVFAEEGLTPQQYAVLLAVRYIEGAVTPTDVARWLDRNTNSITLIVDRMERDGLMSRVRDMPDRRSVRLVITTKGKEMFERATKPGWELIQETMSCLSADELQTFNTLVGKLRQKTVKCLYPDEIAEQEITCSSETLNHLLAKSNEARYQYSI